MAKSLKVFVRECLEAGMSVEATWSKAETERWHASWGYVSKIARDWKREMSSSPSTERKG